MGFVSTGIDALQRMMANLTPYLNKIVLFFFILFIGFLIGKMAGRLVKRLLTDVKADAFFKNLGLRFSIERVTSILVSGLIYVISIIIALNAVGLTTEVLEIILGIFIFALVLSFLIALKDLIPNASAGFALRQKLKEGKTIEMEDAAGMIKELNLLETVIETKNGDLIVIPNALFAKQRIKLKKMKR